MVFNEPLNEELMQNAFYVTNPDLLEMVLSNLKNDTKKCTARAIVKADTTFASLKAELQTLISSEDTFENSISVTWTRVW